MKKTVVGIDPGASGSIAHYKNGVAVAVNMPKTTDELNEYFSLLREGNEDIIVFLEKVNHFTSDDTDPGKKFAIQKMVNNYVQLKTLLSVNKLPYCEVHAATWQSQLLPRFKGEEKSARKKRYLEHAQKLYPEVKVTLSKSDALCIMRFGMERLVDNPKWVQEKTIGSQINNLFN